MKSIRRKRLLEKKAKKDRSSTEIVVGSIVVGIHATKYTFTNTNFLGEVVSTNSNVFDSYIRVRVISHLREGRGPVSYSVNKAFFQIAKREEILSFLTEGQNPILPLTKEAQQRIKRIAPNFQFPPPVSKSDYASHYLHSIDF
jgi:hypothetical protein